MPAFLEPLGHGIFILRTGPTAVKYGDSYTASGVAVAVKKALPARVWDWLCGRRERVCVLKGFTRSSSDKFSIISMSRDIERCLRAEGFTQIYWERQRGVKIHPVMVGCRE